MNLSEYLQQENKRVNGLENEGLNDLMSIARIQKLYSDLRVTKVVKVSLASYYTCSPTLLCSPALKNTTSFEQLPFY